jgi:hypothetical protein
MPCRDVDLLDDWRQMRWRLKAEIAAQSHLAAARAMKPTRLGRIDCAQDVGA